jgi:hypothetical protein
MSQTAKLSRASERLETLRWQSRHYSRLAASQRAQGLRNLSLRSDSALKGINREIRALLDGTWRAPEEST